MNISITRNTLLKSIPLLLYLFLITFFLVRNGSGVIERVIEYGQVHKVLTIWIFLFLYLLKSVSFGLPFVALYAAVAVIYPFWFALFINMLGVFINQQIPFFIGRKRGSVYVTQIEKKFPFISALLKFKDTSHFLFTFLLKLIGKIPHEITNLMLGALGIRYRVSYPATILAFLPEMIPVMIMARGYKDPDSAAFIVSTTLVFAVPLASLLFYLLYRKRMNKKESAQSEV